MSSSREKIGSRVYKLFLLTLLTLTSFSLEAKEISGAFGLSLGEVITGELSEITETTSGKPIYAFEPKNPHPAFSNYGIIITPKTRRIEQIWAWNTFENTSKCQAEFDVIEVLLDKKYKNFKYKSYSFALSHASYNYNKKYIHLSCTLEFRVTPLYLQYTDEYMKDLSVQEKAESQDSDGF